VNDKVAHGAYVVLAAREDASRARRPSAGEIIERGCIIHDVEPERAAVQLVKRVYEDPKRGSETVEMKPSRVYVPLSEIANATIALLKKDHELTRNEEARRDRANWTGLIAAAEALNGSHMNDTPGLTLLVLWTSSLELAVVVKAMMEVRPRVAESMGISIVGEPEPEFDEPLAAALKQLSQ
jgi:hypothetical protein